MPSCGICLLACQLLPRSKGYVRVVSANPLELPLIEPNYLSEDFDLDVHVELVRTARRIAASPSWSNLIGDEVIDRNIDEDPSSDAYIREYVRRSVSTVYHPIGTCKMGGADDTSAVVDDRLRVKGLKRLRVADASVMPRLPTGNTCAPVIMIGEKAAHIIATDNNVSAVSEGA